MTSPADDPPRPNAPHAPASGDPRHDPDQPSGAALALVRTWWTEFTQHVEHRVTEWNGTNAAPRRVTFTRQSTREISVAHPSASTELRLEGMRIRVVHRQGELTRHNLDAATLLTFRHADTIAAVADGASWSPAGMADRVMDELLRRAADT